jgi:hypothetical protein
MLLPSGTELIEECSVLNPALDLMEFVLAPLV